MALLDSISSLPMYTDRKYSPRTGHVEVRPSNRPGFTLIELLVAILVSGILIGVTASTYSLFRRSIALDQSRTDLHQNARIAIDRISRDLRQTGRIVTVLPAGGSSAPAAELEFEDGHASDLSYRRYFLDQGTLKLQTKYYTFGGGVRARQNEVGQMGEAPTAVVLSTQDIAERVQHLGFYGEDDIWVTVVTADGEGQTFSLRTVVQGRNQ